jgi:ferrochelatase
VSSPIAVLAMAYGTPASFAEIEPYYTHVRRGRAPSAEQLAELQVRYAAIGGSSPLRAIASAQVAALERELGLPVGLGYKHAPPFIEDAVAELAQQGVERIVGVVLAPHYSELSVGEYLQRLAAAAATARQSPEVSFVRQWHLEPAYLEYLAGALSATLTGLPQAAHVLFTAHSLPARILESGDPYPEQLRATAAAVAEIAGLGDWDIAWQSAGRTSEPWLRPDVLESITALAATGVPAVAVCPAGFVSDHLEILYDLDIEARRRASALGIAFARTALPNDAPLLIEALAAAVRAALVERVA